MTSVYLKAIARYWWAILGFTIMVTLGSYFFIIASLPINYQSSIKLFVAPASSSALANVYDAPYIDQAVKTVSLLAQGDAFFAQLAGQTGYPVSEVKNSLKVNYIANTQIVQIDVVKNDPNFVSTMVKEIPTVLENHLSSIQKSTDSKNRIQISTAEQTPTPEPAAPFHWQLILAVTLVSLLLAYLVAYLIEYFYNRVEGEQDLEEIGLKYLGNFGLLKNVKKNILAISQKENQHTAEMMREISTNLNFLQTKEHVKSVVVTSANPREGKTLFLTNLAIILAESGKKVALVDCDLRKPFLSRVFNQPNEKGLSDFLSEKGGDILRQTPIKNLFIITAGSKMIHPSKLFDAEKLKELKSILAKDWDIDFVLFDTPPAAVINDAAMVSRAADGVILVAEKGHTKLNDLVRVKNIFEKIDTNILGVVITKGRDQKRIAYYYQD